MLTKKSASKIYTESGSPAGQPYDLCRTMPVSRGIITPGSRLFVVACIVASAVGLLTIVASAVVVGRNEYNEGRAASAARLANAKRDTANHLIDLDRQTKRTAEDYAAWLATHPNIQTLLDDVCDAMKARVAVQLDSVEISMNRETSMLDVTLGLAGSKNEATDVTQALLPLFQKHGYELYTQVVNAKGSRTEFVISLAPASSVKPQPASSK